MPASQQGSARVHAGSLLLAMVVSSVVPAGAGRAQAPVAGFAGSPLLAMVVSSVVPAGAAGPQAPAAGFAGSPAAGPPPLTVRFTDTSTSSPTAWRWDFGDGAGSTAQNPHHDYTREGAYTVSLTVSNASGEDTEVVPDLVTVTMGRIVHVANAAELVSAVRKARDGDTIMIADGVYESPGAPFLRLEGRTKVTIRGASGDASRVVLRGRGWASEERNDDILWLWGDHDVVVSHLTFEECRGYGIKMQNTRHDGRGLRNITISHCRFRNIGTRMIKGTGGDGVPVEVGTIRHCDFENTRIPPGHWLFEGNYVSAIDCMVLRNWTICDNVFRNIKGHSGGGRGAIFIWVESENVVSERNVITGCDRSICYGNPSSSSVGPSRPHMSDGTIRNNFIVAGADTGIEICWANGVKVYHNTVLTGDEAAGNGIHYHWRDLAGVRIAHNIVRGRIYGDDAADVAVESNVTSGVSDSWFVDVESGDLHLTAAAAPAIDQVSRLPDCATDFDEEERPTEAGAADIGADERLVD